MREACADARCPRRGAAALGGRWHAQLRAAAAVGAERPVRSPWKRKRRLPFVLTAAVLSLRSSAAVAAPAAPPAKFTLAAFAPLNPQVYEHIATQRARFFQANRLGNQLYLYAGVLMITDNTLIYLFHFAVAFLISRIEPSRQADPLIRHQQPAYGRQIA